MAKPRPLSPICRFTPQLTSIMSISHRGWRPLAAGLCFAWAGIGGRYFGDWRGFGPSKLAIFVRFFGGLVYQRKWGAAFNPGFRHRLTFLGYRSGQIVCF
ncbi:MAG: hypothetical protein CM15mP46_5620 [Alphaproteobacteria bacterium]|nr:MAG: hypothetical protein CM15mP46_5620 [Alphaproteobacteria bacterium]